MRGLGKPGRRALGCAVGSLVLAALTLGAPPPAAGQTATATLVVEARDASGGVLPGVVVLLTNRDNGIGRKGLTSEEGALAVPYLPPGTYTLAASLDGFKTEIVRDIRLEAAVKSTLRLSMEAGSYAEQVVVTADLTTLRIGNSAVGEVYDSGTMLSLPVLERDALQFASQSPGVAPPAPGSRLSTQGNTGLNVGGAREASNNFLLDGIDNNDLFLNRLVVNPSLDAIQEVSLLQNTYDAEYGRSAGAQVNVVLKSGTSELRGSAYEFFRHDALDARNRFEPRDRPQTRLRKHQFGGTLGGPMGRLPSFFFTNVEGVQAIEADTRLARVPTLAERAGDFSASSAPVVDPFTGRPFPGNVIPASRLSAAGLAAAALYPAPNRSGGAANVVSSPQGERDAIQFTVKTDHHQWQENPITVRYTFSRDDRSLPFPARARNVPGFGVTVLDQGHNAAAALTQTLSARVFNELRVGVNALRRENLPRSAGIDGFAAIGARAPALGAVDLGYPTLVVPGFETLGDDPNLPVLRRTRTIHVSDSLTIESGRHNAKFGGEYRRYRSDGLNHLFARGQAVFQGVYTGNPVADLLLGFPTITLLGVNDNRQALRTWSVNLFAQDDWRLSPTFTLNAGIRYEYGAPPYDADDRMRIYDAATNRLLQVGADGVPRSGLNGDFNNVAPRVGFSWDVSRRGTLIVRGGYGIFYDSGTLIENSALYFNPPYWSLQLFFPGATSPIRLEDPYPAGRGIATAPAVNTLDPDFRTGFAHQASLAVERVFGSTTVTARYVGAFGENLVRKRNLNQPTPAPGPIAGRRPIAGFGDILLVESQASSRYHSLQLAVERRYSRHLAFRAGYTWSKSLDDTSAFLATDGDDNTPQDGRNFAAEWGPSDYDVRHRLVASATYDVPARQLLLRNWQLSAILTAQSGRPFTPRVSFDNSNTGNVGGGTFAYDRPNVVQGQPPPGTAVASYGGQTFVVPPRFTFGNAGRNSLTGPGYASLDAAVTRRIGLPGARTLDLRAEVFNALNRANYQLPDSFVDRATFGQSLTAFPPRQLQLSVRFTF